MRQCNSEEGTLTTVTSQPRPEQLSRVPVGGPILLDDETRGGSIRLEQLEPVVRSGLEE